MRGRVGVLGGTDEISLDESHVVSKNMFDHLKVFLRPNCGGPVKLVQACLCAGEVLCGLYWPVEKCKPVYVQ